MTRGLEITLGGSFRIIAGAYVDSFSRAYIAYSGKIVEVNSPLNTYKQVIINNGHAIFRAAAAEINRYLSNYSVHANQSADELKVIYFVGRSIEKHLVNDGFPEIAQVHMFCMIGLLDYRLQHLQIEKPTLTKALTRLVRLNVFHEELGRTGCYLAYKSVSTIKKGGLAVQA